MAEYLGTWPSKRGPICKIRPSEGCGRDAVLLAVERRYDFPESGGYVGNVSYMLSSRDNATTNRGDIIGYFAVTQVVLLFVVVASGLLR